ncbi:DMT family transporter [Actibacterium pelagium]|uniref:Peptide ABC transporter permease n=1 Tax=Actibacterium pelagium TaxID=2029103 RepID=A0A917AGM7_9RHOB|nr:DMT family transporter [Actibacterium pelagium]GGE51787.1 peptide ABC transporter permease [Actibacterium pelagium]
MDFRSLILGLSFALFWSSAFTSARVIVEYAPPLLSLSLRFFVSGLLGLLIAWALGQSFRLSREQWRATIVFGICQNALYLGLFFVAMQTVEASLAAIIASSMPLIVGLFGWLFLKQRLPLLGLVGLVAGLGGVAVIMGTRLSGGVDLAGIAYCVIGVLALSIATLSVRGASSGGNLITVVGLQMLVGGACLLVAGLILEEPTFTPSWQLGVAFVYTTLVPGLTATIIWFVLVGRIGAVKAATYHFLNPFFGVAIAAVLLGEKMGFYDILGVVIITFSILAVQLSKQQN